MHSIFQYININEMTQNIEHYPFSRTFHTVVGQTPLAYLNRWRMNLATQLLLNGKSIGRAAIGLGFNSQSAFSRTFSQYLGKSPRAWLSEQKY